jgi:hypothetical protein
MDLKELLTQLDEDIDPEEELIRVTRLVQVEEDDRAGDRL